MLSSTSDGFVWIARAIRLVVVDVFSAKLAVPLDSAERNSLSGALSAALAVLGVLVLFLATDERRIGLDFALERRIEEVRGRGVTEGDATQTTLSFA
jgi:hypothetical protein